MRCRKFIAVQSSFFLSFFAFKHHISMWHMPRTRKKHTQTILTVTGMQMQNKANYLHISLSGEQPGWLHHLVKKLTLVMLLTEEIDTQRLSWHDTTLDRASNNSEFTKVRQWSSPECHHHQIGEQRRGAPFNYCTWSHLSAQDALQMMSWFLAIDCRILCPILLLGSTISGGKMTKVVVVYGLGAEQNHPIPIQFRHQAFIMQSANLWNFLFWSAHSFIKEARRRWFVVGHHMLLDILCIFSLPSSSVIYVSEL